MTASVDAYHAAEARAMSERPPATVSLERKGRKWVVTVVCNDCGFVVGRYPGWFEHAPDCPQRKDGK